MQLSITISKFDDEKNQSKLEVTSDALTNSIGDCKQFKSILNRQDFQIPLK